MSISWTTKDIPDQRGKTAIVTGATSGIGYEAAKALVEKGAHVILAVRDTNRGEQAAARIRRGATSGQVDVMKLDLANLGSIRSFADEFHARFDELPLLINNAGVMALPYRATADGFEMQFGTNHLGHFALTSLLLPAILAAPAARVVTVSSGLHRSGTIDFANLDGTHTYDPWRAYSQSKLANLLFAYELQRRFAAVGSDAISVGCHPGFAATNLQAAGPRMEGSQIKARLAAIGTRLLGQSAAMGALPTLFAAIDPSVNGCDYIGPDRLGGMRGHPTKTYSNNRSYDVGLAQRLWTISEELTEVHYSFAAPVGV